MHRAGPRLGRLSSPGARGSRGLLVPLMVSCLSLGLHSDCSLFVAGPTPHPVVRFLGVLAGILVCICMYPLKQWQGFCPSRTPVATL